MIRKLFLFVFVIDLLFHFSQAEGMERLLIDEIGRKVEILHSAKRIVSMAPSITEILFALGLNEELVGVTDFCDYPEAALAKPRIGGFVNPKIERIVSLKPDLILATRDGNRMETVHRIEDLGFPIFVIDPKGFDGVMKTIKNIGEIVLRQEESTKIVRDMMTRKENVARLTRPLSKPKVFFQMGYAPMMTVGKGSLADDLIRMAGGRSISEDESMSYKLYSIETILSKAPEVIIVSSMEHKRDHSHFLKMWQKWKTIPAVKMNAVYLIDSNLVDRPSPRIVEGLETIVKMIHPEILGNPKN